jgi:hypothetical protein
MATDPARAARQPAGCADECNAQRREEKMMATETPRADGALAGLARFCYRRRRLVLLTWIVGVIAVAFVGFGYGAASDNK